MWTKIAVGAVVGFVIGAWAGPGVTLWIVAGVLAAYGVERGMRRRAASRNGGHDGG